MNEQIDFELNLLREVWLKLRELKDDLKNEKEKEDKT